MCYLFSFTNQYLVSTRVFQSLPISASLCNADRNKKHIVHDLCTTPMSLAGTTVIFQHILPQYTICRGTKFPLSRKPELVHLITQARKLSCLIQGVLLLSLRSVPGATT